MTIKELVERINKQYPNVNKGVELYLHNKNGFRYGGPLCMDICEDGGYLDNEAENIVTKWKYNKEANWLTIYYKCWYEDVDDNWWKDYWKIDKYYDVKRWINKDRVIIHYWDDDNGDYYLEENRQDLLDNMFEEDEDDGMTSYCVKHY